MKGLQIRHEHKSELKRLAPGERAHRINLGISISHALTKPGQCRTHREIAAFCDCTFQMIYNIEEKALKKLRKALVFRKDPVMQALLEVLLEGNHRQAAQPAGNQEAMSFSV